MPMSTSPQRGTPTSRTCIGPNLVPGSGTMARQSAGPTAACGGQITGSKKQ